MKDTLFIYKPTYCSSDIIFQVIRETEKSIFYKVVKNGNLDFHSRIAKSTFYKEYNIVK